jgi:hypothetical protein
MPRTGSSLTGRRGAGTPGRRACRTGPWRPGGEADRGSRRRRRAAGIPAGTPRCRRRPWPVSGSGPGPGHELLDGWGRRPLIIQRPGPRQAAGPRERHGGAGRLRFSSPARWLPGAPAPCPGITLSDTGGQGERAHCRRYARPAARVAWSRIACRRINLQCAVGQARGRVPYITSESMPFFDRSGSVHAARSKQQGRRLPERSFKIPTSTRRSRV